MTLRGTPIAHNDATHHTPGPWKVALGFDTILVNPFHERGGTHARVIETAEGVTVAWAAGPTREQDARLIAAAPAMKDFLLDVPHNDYMTTTHRLVGHVAGCRGCEARALLKEIEG